MGMRFKEKLILLAAEPSYLQATTPVAADYQRAMDLTITFEEEGVSDEVEQGFEGNVEEIPTGEHVSISYKTHIFGSGTAGTPPPFAAALLACRLAQIIEAGERTRYVIAGDNGASCAARIRFGKNLHAIGGMRGTVDVVFEKGIPMFQFQFKGTWNPPTHQNTALPSIDNAPWLKYQPTGPGRTSNVTLHGQTVRPYSLNMALGNEPIYDESLVDAQIIFNERSPSGKMQIEAPTLDVINFFTRASNRKHGPLALQHGQTAGNIFKLAAPRVQVKKPVYTKLDTGNVGYDIDYMPLPVNGNDEYELIFE